MMKKVEKTVHRVKLTDYELRIGINALNEQRKKQRAKGEDASDLDKLILKLLDTLENK